MDRKELELAASKVTYLRGLLAVPLGVLFLLTGLGNLGWAPLQSTWVFLACLAVLGVGWAALNRYYNNHYGRVSPGHRPGSGTSCRGPSSQPRWRAAPCSRRGCTPR